MADKITRNWYRRCGADFIHGTMGLSLEEKGAYSLCLDLIYDHRKPIPDDARWLSGVCGVSIRKWNAIRTRLISEGKLISVDGFLMNFRAEKEIEISAKAKDKLSETGAKGGRNSRENDSTSNENNDLYEAIARDKLREVKLSEVKEKTEPKGSSKKPGTRLPHDWMASEEDISFAVELSLSQEEIENAEAEFRDFWIGVPGQRGVKVDWPATWRNNVRRVKAKSRPTAFPQQKSAHRQHQDACREAVKREIERLENGHTGPTLDL